LTAALRFQASDLDLFRAASHDRNAVHAPRGGRAGEGGGSAESEPIVFGVLALLAVASSLRSESVSSVRAEFRAPLRIGVDYEIERLENDAASVTATVARSGRRLLRAEFAPGDTAGSEGGIAARPARTLGRSWTMDELRERPVLEGSYGPEPAAFDALRAAWPGARGLTAGPWAALLWCSYFVGMELPGQQAIFGGLNLRFQRAAPPEPAPLDYSARVTRADDRFGLLRIEAALRWGGQPLADVALDAFFHPDPMSKLGAA
jgi:hypothetical protein